MLGALFDRWAAKRQARELEAFLAIIRTIPDAELGTVVVLAEDFRVRLLATQGLDLNRPFDVIALSPMLTYDISKTIIAAQKDGRQHAVPGMMIWVHTLRAALRFELREQAREMWVHMARGFPYVDDGFSSCATLLGRLPQFPFDRQLFPEGFAPHKTIVD